MNKEPIAFYFFRIFLSLMLLVFMGMLYWSSVLVEDRLRDVQLEVHEIKDLINKRGLGQRKEEVKAAFVADHKDSKYPNLLKTDSFYTDTLPKLLAEGFIPTGTRHDATVGKPDNLHPFSSWKQVNDWLSLCSGSLSRLAFGRYETFAPAMAYRIEERVLEGEKVPEFWVFLRKDLFWQPLKKSFFPKDFELAEQFLKKTAVTAHDFKFYLDAIANPYVQQASPHLRKHYASIKSFEIIDDYTFVIRWEPTLIKDEYRIPYMTRQLIGGLSPLASHIYKYFADGSKIVEDDQDPDTYRQNSVWGQNFSDHWAKNVIPSCGAYIFDGMNDRGVRFVRNPDHYQPLDVLVEGIDVRFKNSSDGIWQSFKLSDIDLYSISPQQLVEWDNFQKSDLYQKQVESGSRINSLEYLHRAYIYIGWNAATPLFSSSKTRLAMTLAIDRRRIIDRYLNGKGEELTGPFAKDSTSYNNSIKPWPYDKQRAKQLLEEDGWLDRNGDGVISKMIDGKSVPFSFFLTYYVKNPISKSICEYISGALKEIGVKCQLKGVDVADLGAAFQGKSFDAICLGWALGTPPEDPYQLWHSSGAKEPGSSNAVGFASDEADQVIEQLVFERDKKKRQKLYHRFSEIIHQAQPYTFLYIPKTTLLYRDYIQNLFIPSQRQDLVPGANIAQPDESVIWIKGHK